MKLRSSRATPFRVHVGPEWMPYGWYPFSHFPPEYKEMIWGLVHFSRFMGRRGRQFSVEPMLLVPILHTVTMTTATTESGHTRAERENACPSTSVGCRVCSSKLTYLQKTQGMIKMVVHIHINTLISSRYLFFICCHQRLHSLFHFLHFNIWKYHNITSEVSFVNVCDNSKRLSLQTEMF